MAAMMVFGMPCLVLLMSLASRFASGPFWLGTNIDPSYQYLMNSLYLADHKVPLYFQHPGIPVQLLGAVIIKLLNFFVPDGRMVENVLRAPEFYLHAMYAALILFYAGTLAALSWYAYRCTKDVMFAFLVQAPAFLYLTMCKEAGFTIVPANVCPETLIMGLLNIYGIYLLRAFFIEDKKESWATALGWGIVYGVMVGAKFTCLSLVVIPLALLPSLRDKLLFCVAVAAAFVLATAPVWSRYPAMWDNLYLMSTHTEFRGKGSGGFIAWDSFRNGLMVTFAQQWLLMGSVASILGAIFYNRIALRPRVKLSRAYRWTVWIGLAVILQFLMVAKETAYHYMVPAMGLFGFLWAFMYLGSASKSWIWHVAVLFFVMSSIVLNFIYIKNSYRSSQTMQHFSREVYKHTPSAICTFYRCSSIPFALAFGDDCFGLNAYEDLIQKLYPNNYAMDILQFKIDNPPNTFIEDALAHGQQAFLYGSVLGESFFSPMFKVKLVARAGDEAAYEVLEAHDRKAFQMFYMAQMALMQGQGQAAYALGSQAKALGLPAARDFIARMDEVITR